MFACSRRSFLKTAAVPVVAPLAVAQSAPTAPVAVARCSSYGTELLPALERMFDQLGGLGRIVKGKTVAVKLNLTGSPEYRLGHHPLGDTHYTHPRVIAAVCHLMGKAGAHRIRLLESCWSTADPVEEYILRAGWDPGKILSSAPRVEFENTNWLGSGRHYSVLKTPRSGHMFRAYYLNHSYEDCDVFVTLAKMKEHATAGITLAMKNSFGITPATIYGRGAGIDEPSEMPRGGRTMIHSGDRQPAKPAPAENDPNSPRDGGYRVPRVVADLAAARPIHLAVIDGIVTMTGGEGPWVRRKLAVVKPGLVVAGTNAVTVDAVSMALMGFDPMADRGTAPFETCDNTLRLAEELGVGTRDLRRIEVIGAKVEEARFPFRG